MELASDAPRQNNISNDDVGQDSKTTSSWGSTPRFVLFLSYLLLLAFSNLGCKSPAAPAEEKVPPAPIKWEEIRQLVVLEEWTELVGTTQPLPNHAARVTSTVGGRVVAVLPNRGGKPIVEGQTVEEGDVLI